MVRTTAGTGKYPGKYSPPRRPMSQRGGWFEEPYRHALARRGIRSVGGRKMPKPSTERDFLDRTLREVFADFYVRDRNGEMIRVATEELGEMEEFIHLAEHVGHEWELRFPYKVLETHEDELLEDWTGDKGYNLRVQRHGEDMVVMTKD